LGVTIDLTKFEGSQAQIGEARLLLAECRKEANMTHVSQPFTGETIESHLQAVSLADGRCQLALLLNLPDLLKVAQLDYELAVQRAENFAKWYLAEAATATDSRQLTGG